MITAKDNLQHVFTNLAAFDEAGMGIMYTIEEVEIIGCEVSITSNTGEGFVVTNMYIEPESENTEEKPVDGSKNHPQAKPKEDAKVHDREKLPKISTNLYVNWSRFNINGVAFILNKS